MVPRVLARLDDMLRATKVIEDLLRRNRPLDGVEYLALERALEILSEASRHVPDTLKSDFPNTPWREIAGLGNILRHQYDRVDPDIILRIALQHVPGLQPILRQMIERIESEG